MGMVQNHYEINVSYEGRHFFATAERSAVDEAKAAELYDTFKRKFPESEGFKVSVTHIQCCGFKIDFENEGDE